MKTPYYNEFNRYLMRSNTLSGDRLRLQFEIKKLKKLIYKEFMKNELLTYYAPLVLLAAFLICLFLNI